MRVKIPEYDRGACYVGCFSSSEETDCELSRDELNIIHYCDGTIILVNEECSYPISEDQREELADLHDYDVLEIFENGTMVRQFSEYAGDNTLFITSLCNSNCVMCPSSEYSRKRGVIPEEEEVLSLARHYSRGANHITITGGEPFLFRNSMFKVLQILKERLQKTEFLVLTNGRIFCLDTYVKNLIDTMPTYTILAIPLHGSTAKKHDAITQAEGSYTQTISGITKLLDQNVPVEIRIVVSKLNVYDIEAIAKLIVSTFPRVYRVHFIGLEMLGNAAINAERVWLPYREAFAATKNAIDLLINAGINVALYNFPLCAVEKAYWQLCKKSISDYKRYYPEKCLSCNKNNICGGVFVSSLRFAEADLCPFED